MERQDSGDIAGLIDRAGWTSSIWLGAVSGLFSTRRIFPSHHRLWLYTCYCRVGRVEAMGNPQRAPPIYDPAAWFGRGQHIGTASPHVDCRSDKNAVNLWIARRKYRRDDNHRLCEAEYRWSLHRIAVHDFVTINCYIVLVFVPVKDENVNFCLFNVGTGRYAILKLFKNSRADTDCVPVRHVGRRRISRHRRLRRGDRGGFVVYGAPRSAGTTRGRA